MGETYRSYQSRERMRPWPIHVLTAIGAFIVLILAALVVDISPSTGFAIGGAGVVGGIVFDAVRCRPIAIGDEGLTVGTRTFAWSEIAQTHVREVPIARAGLFVQLTDAARRKHRMGTPRYRGDGFGLQKASTDEHFDLFLRAHRDRLEEWFARVSIYELRKMRGDMQVAMEGAGLVVPGPPRPSQMVSATLIVDALEALTIELRAPSIEAVMADAARAIGAALPDAARWDPSFAGGVMVLVGPLELSNDSRAEACLEHVRQAARSQLAGTPRAVQAVFAAR